MSLRANKRIKLTYFDHTWGRALAIRLAFRYKGEDYEDNRVKFPQLVEMRGACGQNAKVPLGVLPIIEFPDGQVSSQSMALARYAGKKAGLYPIEEYENALLVDEFMETALEMVNNMPAFNSDEERKVTIAKREKYIEKNMLRYLNFLSEKLDTKPGRYLLGSELSIGDLILFQVMYNIKDSRVEGLNFDEVFRAYPTLQKFYQNLLDVPFIKQELQADSERYAKSI